MQTKHETELAKQIEAPANIMPYVPPFLAIKANNIEQWVSNNNISARTRFAVFLRYLVHSTGYHLEEVNFPGNDDAERPGWDGYIKATTGTPWVPAGISGWEFGTNKDIATKATNDFDKSIKAIAKEQQKQITFIFVTPRRWSQKDNWANKQRARNIWKDVRVFDSSDLEQWLEQSIPAQVWFANETGIRARDVRSLDQCWDDWANVTNPPLPKELFAPAVRNAKEKVLNYLQEPPQKPMYIGADSTEEALGFLSEIFSEGCDDSLAKQRYQVLVFKEPEALKQLMACARHFTPIVFTREAESELAKYVAKVHSFIVYPRNSPNINFDAVVDLISTEVFSNALMSIGKTTSEITSLAGKSGRSLTVLRRQLSTVASIKSPEWATNNDLIDRLIPFMFVGILDTKNDTDKATLELLSDNIRYNELERTCLELSHLSDAPIWRTGEYIGVVSKMDLLHIIAPAITERNLSHFFEVAELILGEADPALELAEDRRWLAPIYGKTRKLSVLFRKGIAETLVMLAVYEKELFGQRLNMKLENKVDQLIGQLLPTPLTTQTLETHDNDLPTYAEAAPNKFLSILEQDLLSETPAVLGLLRPASSDFFSSPKRTNLLWALERLLWNPSTLARSALILAQLAQTEIHDNWDNKPIDLLLDIFRVWMPQTTANCEQRLTLLKKLKKDYPELAWRICIEQASCYPQPGSYTHKFHWRDEGMEFSKEPTGEDQNYFLTELAGLLFNWTSYTSTMLGELVECLLNFPTKEQEQLLEIITAWAKYIATDEEKAILRETIRISLLSHHAVNRAKNKDSYTRLFCLVSSAYNLLEPKGIINKHSWLFVNVGIEETAEEKEDSLYKQEERIRAMRIEAIKEIYAEKGAIGILKLSEQGNGNGALICSNLLTTKILPYEELKKLLFVALMQSSEEQKENSSYRTLIFGILRKLESDMLIMLLQQVITKLPNTTVLQLLLLAPFCKSTWTVVISLGEKAREEYWNKITPSLAGELTTDVHEAITNLLGANRPHAAFAHVSSILKEIDPRLLYFLLDAIAKSNNDKRDNCFLNPSKVKKAFELLSNCAAISEDEMATLEFAYVELLENTLHLEKYIENHPEFFAQLISIASKNLTSFKNIPGSNEFQAIDASKLETWISTVRQLCGKQNRSNVADNCIGRLLSNSPVGQDDAWPCEEVRDIVEKLQSESIIKGMYDGILSPAGDSMCYWDVVGRQELSLAKQYQAWQEKLQITHPFIASQLLQVLAKGYERQAEREDTEHAVVYRLNRY